MNWELAFGVATLVAVILGAFLARYRELLKESREFYDAVKEARADNKITWDEMDLILKEGKDVAQVIGEIVRLVNKKY